MVPGGFKRFPDGEKAERIQDRPGCRMGRRRSGRTYEPNGARKLLDFRGLSSCDVSHFNIRRPGHKFQATTEFVMTRPFHQDPTEFFSVVGAPFPRERASRPSHGYELRTDDQRPRRLEIGAATIFAGFCAVALGVSLFAGTGAARLVEVAYQAVK
jgi:hypothetical protein